MPSYRKFWPFFESICPVMAKLYKVMIRYDQIMQRYTSYGQIWQVQSFSQIWTIYTKICSEMAMLCKITAKIGQVIQSSGQFIQIYVQIWLAKLVKLHKDKDFFSGQPVVSAQYLSGILFSAQFSSQFLVHNILPGINFSVN